MSGLVLVATIAIAGLVILGATILIVAQWMRRSGGAGPQKLLAVICAVCFGLAVLLVVAWAARNFSFWSTR